MELLKQLITITITILSVGVLVFAQPVYADSCPNPGPYDICIPQTDIVMGNMVIEDSTLQIMACVSGIGVCMILLSQFMRDELNTSSSR